MTRSFTFRHKIVTSAALVMALAFTCFILVNDYRQRITLRSNADSSMQIIGTLTSGNIQSWLEGRIQLLQSMGQLITQDGNTPDDVRHYIGLPAYSNNFLLSSFGSQDGVYFSVPVGNLAADYDPRTRGWYKEAVAAGKTVLTEPYISASSGKWVITIASPIKHNNQLRGVAAVNLDLGKINDIINSLNLGGHGQAFIVSGEGKILIHADSKLILKTLSEAYPADAPSISPGHKEVRVGGKTQFVSFTHINGIPSANWYVALVLDQDEIFAMLSEFRSAAIIATIIAVVIIVALLGVLVSLLMQPLSLMNSAMREIADGDGDLTQRLTIHNQDEFGALGSSFNRFVQRIHDSIREVSSTTEQLNNVAQKVVSASNALMLNSDQQAIRTGSVAAAINELGAVTQEIARNAALGSQRSGDARNQTVRGQEVVIETLRAMNQLSTKITASSVNIENLNASTVNIEQILEVITSISQQTNLLALNAAIEAARAGETGRGFSVVADEVRNLAHRTQESAQQVQLMIGALQVSAREAVSIMVESQRESESSVTVANRAGELLKGVTQCISEIDGMNQSIATATEEQTAVVESINVDITEINALNREGGENLQATLLACSDLEQQASRLKQLVGNFLI